LLPLPQGRVASLLERHAAAVAEAEEQSLARLSAGYESVQGSAQPQGTLSPAQLRSALKQALVCEVGDAEALEAQALAALQVSQQMRLVTLGWMTDGERKNKRAAACGQWVRAPLKLAHGPLRGMLEACLGLSTACQLWVHCARCSMRAGPQLRAACSTAWRAPLRQFWRVGAALTGEDSQSLAEPSALPLCSPPGLFCGFCRMGA
jgi:hypothetical protein